MTQRMSLGGKSVCGRFTQRSLGSSESPVLRSSTSNFDDPWRTARQVWAKPSVRNVLWFWWIILPWRLGAVHDSLAHRLPGGIQAVVLGVGYPFATSRHALGGAWCGERRKPDVEGDAYRFALREKGGACGRHDRRVELGL